METLASIFLALLFSMFYLAPTLVAAKKKYLAGIFIVNVFFGWTIVGWVGALVWAVSSPNNES